jgi:hypothetical protein
MGLQELLSFQGCEIYDKEWPELVGRTFDEVCIQTRGRVGACPVLCYAVGASRNFA